MNKKDISIVMPLSSVDYWIRVGMTVICFVFGLALVAAMILLLVENAYLPAIFALIYTAVLIYIGVFAAKSASRSIELTQDKLILKHNTCWQTEIPIEDVKLFSIVKYPHRGMMIHMLGICPYTQEELTRRQEKRMQKGVFTRYDLPFLKRQADWEKRLAQTYILRKVKRIPFLKQDIISVPWDSSITQQLKLCYPQIPWMNVEEK